MEDCKNTPEKDGKNSADNNEEKCTWNLIKIIQSNNIKLLTVCKVDIKLWELLKLDLS